MRPSLSTATGEGRRRIRALVASLTPLIVLLALIQPATVLAKPPTGTVTIIDGVTGEQTIVDGEPEVCTFAVIFDFDLAFPLVGWKIKDWVPGNWNESPSRFKGQGATDDDGVIRIPDNGFFTLSEGRYNVIADDEWPPDGSSIVQSFHVVCPAFVDPIPTPPDGAGEPIAGEPSPAASESGEIGAVVGTPRPTLPPTDGGVGSVMTSSDTWLAIAGLGALAFVVVLLTPRHRGVPRRRR